MKERPILMHARSINGILAGRKTQTRRIAKIPDFIRGSEAPQAKEGKPPKHRFPYFDCYCSEKKTEVNPRGMSNLWGWWDEYDRWGCDDVKCPYGVPGDRLWVREHWLPRNSGTLYRADHDPVEAAGLAGMYSDKGKWKPAMFMPRWASRLTLEITDIRVERVQDISEADCIAEGVQNHIGGGICACPAKRGLAPAKCDFAGLWDETNGKGAWDRNDWVWVVGFKQLSSAHSSLRAGKGEPDPVVHGQAGLTER